MAESPAVTRLARRYPRVPHSDDADVEHGHSRLFRFWSGRQQRAYVTRPVRVPVKRRRARQEGQARLRLVEREQPLEACVAEGPQATDLRRVRGLVEWAPRLG